MRTITVLAAALLLSGCASRKAVAMRESADTLERQVEIRQRLCPVEVRLPPESVAVVVPLPPEPSLLATAAAESRAWVDSLGRLHHSLRQLPVALKATAAVADTLVTASHRSAVTESRQPDESNYCPWWLVTAALGALGALLLARK